MKSGVQNPVTKTAIALALVSALLGATLQIAPQPVVALSDVETLTQGVNSTTSLAATTATTATQAISLKLLGTYATGRYSTVSSAAEIAGHDAATQRLFVVNGMSATLDIVSIANPMSPTLFASVALSPAYGIPNSVAVKNGIVAVAVESITKTDPGKVVFFNAAGTFQSQVTVGSLPDMVTFTPDGSRVLVANEAEPNASYSIDPEGSISIITMTKPLTALAQSAVTTLGFGHFTTATLDPKVRVFGRGASIAQDIEPEYIAVAPDGLTAFVTLQENNALAVINIAALTITQVLPLGYKDHSLPGNAFDGSDRDLSGSNGKINIANWPVMGMYMPDGISAWRSGSGTFLITANEGDARDYGAAYAEEARVSALNLDPVRFPLSNTLKANTGIGRLNVTTATNLISSTYSPDTDGDGDIDTLYSFGGRSISIWSPDGVLVWDSGDLMERYISDTLPTAFNSDATGAFDTRSDNKGPEPESVVVGRVAGKDYAFVALERIGGVMAFDVSNPLTPTLATYANNRVYSTTLNPAAKDLGPEGLLFIPAEQSPTGGPLIVVVNEVSGSTSIWSVDSPDTLALIHTNDVHGRVDEYNNDGSYLCSGDNCIGGVARMKTVIDNTRGAMSSTLLLDAGDQFQGTLFYSEYKADIVTRTMNALGYDAMAVGNHELDDGPAELRKLIDGVTFPVLSANMTATNEPALAGKLKASTVITRNGVPYGIIGLTTEDTPFLSSGGDNVQFTSAISAAKMEVGALQTQGVNRIIVVSHLGYDVEMALAAAITGVDVIVGGHTHSFLYSPVITRPNGDVPAGPYPTVVTAPDGNKVLVTTAFQWGRYLGRLNVTFSTSGTVSAWDGQPVLLDASVPKDPVVQAIISPTFSAPLAALRNTVVGTTTVALSQTVNSVQICRQQECILGNLVADAMLWKANDMVSGTTASAMRARAVLSSTMFDFAIQNGGGLRAPINEGPVTLGEVLETLPFGNTLATFEITGTHVISSIESGLRNIGISGNGRFPQVAGMRYFYKPNNPVGKRLVAVQVEQPDGSFVPIDPNRVYRVVTNNFMRNGGDGYALFRSSAINPYDFGPGVDEALSGYLDAFSPVTPQLEGRVVRLTKELRLPLVSR